MKRVLLSVVFLFLVAAARDAQAAGRSLDFPLRGKVLTLTVYLPPAGGQPKGRVIMGSGDVGWVGLGVEMAEFLAGQGYCVVGVNIRQYLSVFTSGTSRLTTTEPPADYAALAEFLKARHLLWDPAILSGVSEGAALAVLVASSEKNHAWVHGVITMGLPPTAELAWRWSDFTTWITKKDANEPMFAPKDFIASVSPLPICLIHSTKDEYVTEADWKLFEATARAPKRLVLIAASNHRFTDKKQELKDQFTQALAWVLAEGKTSRGSRAIPSPSP